MILFSKNMKKNLICIDFGMIKNVSPKLINYVSFYYTTIKHLKGR